MNKGRTNIKVVNSQNLIQPNIVKQKWFEKLIPVVVFDKVYGLKHGMKDLVMKNVLPTAKDEKELNKWIERANKRAMSNERNPY